jgi:Rap1a immunity proteins
VRSVRPTKVGPMTLFVSPTLYHRPLPKVLIFLISDNWSPVFMRALIVPFKTIFIRAYQMRWLFVVLIVFETALQIGIDKAFALTGEQLLQSCEAVLRQTKTVDPGNTWVPNEGLACWHYFEAIEDMTAMVDPSSQCTTLPCKNPLLSVCPSLGITHMQYIRIFVLAAQQYPEFLHQPATALAIAALRKAFPCR